MDSISWGEGSMAAPFTLNTRCINDYNFPTPINLILLCLSPLLRVHLSPPLVASLVFFFRLIPHRSIRGLQSYIPLQRNATHDSELLVHQRNIKWAQPPFFCFPTSTEVSLKTAAQSLERFHGLVAFLGPVNFACWSHVSTVSTGTGQVCATKNWSASDRRWKRRRGKEHETWQTCN